MLISNLSLNFATLLHFKIMKKFLLLFSTTLSFSLAHTLCCMLPYLAWSVGLIGLLPYVNFLLPFQSYLIVLQLVLFIYTVYRAHTRYRPYYPKIKIGVGVLLLLYVLLLIFPYYQHAQAEKKNYFGKKIIQKIK